VYIYKPIKELGKYIHKPIKELVIYSIQLRSYIYISNQFGAR